ncbi:glutamine-hydrolyzing asparagine synthase [Jaminaea rosea]|uniref:Glutamine-hydrolyzing asparagine synthase n=1 Tax=Jaminaea rosea TaxID=1569628 RepID=A0A316UNI0_9BASI|nr:glutamine-hydrolyzing asparagine synthase [Jaminaea rosea]PWN25473.1 glutamine-hydrolyzing asparagine synthase [Jaminaea rosea]
MCGIDCLLDLSGRAQDSQHVKERLERGLDAIAHRGPDGGGTWVSNDARVALGHARLAIMGPDARGCQPMASTSSSARAIVNGEFYEWEQLLNRLCPNYSCASSSDSELLLALYDRFDGDIHAVLPHLRGEFAFVLHDPARAKLYAVRDRYGIKPLYYTVEDQQLAFCSEIKGLLAMLPSAPRWDLSAALNEGWRTGNSTLLSGIRWVKPGSLLEVDLHTNSITEQSYFVRQFPLKSIDDARPIDALVAGVRSRLIDAIRVRLRSDVPVGVFLSGGVDSSAVAGIVAHLLKAKAAPALDPSVPPCTFRCFTIDFDHEWSEAGIAQRTAEWVGAQYCPLKVDEEMLCQYFEEVIAQCELPYADLGCVAKYLLARFAKQQGVKVVLTGEGSDEHLAGYPIFRGDRFAERDAAMGQCEDAKPAKELLQPLPSFYGLPANKPRCSTSARPPLAHLAMHGMLSTSHHHEGLQEWAESFIDPSGGDAALDSLLDSLPRKSQEAIREDKYHPLHTALLVYQRSTFVTQQLTHLGDRVEMAHALEARTPFLDHHLTQFIDSLPPSLKLRFDPRTKALREKWILYEAARPFITPEVYERVKQPFVAAPRRYPRGGPMHRLLQRLLTREGVQAVGWLDSERVERLMVKAFGKDEHMTGATDDAREAKVATAQALLCAEMCLFAKRWGVEKLTGQEKARVAADVGDEVRKRVRRVD